MLRPIRIIGTAATLAFLFRMSQQFMSARGEEPVAGYTVALGVITVLFLVRAAVTEYAATDVSELQKDILWGLSLGSFVSMLARLAQ